MLFQFTLVAVIRSRINFELIYLRFGNVFPLRCGGC